MKIITNKLVEIYGITDVYLSYSKAFKHQQIQMTFTLPSDELEIKELLSVKADIVNLEYKIEDSVSGKSCEGQILSSKKLATDAYVQYRIEYSSVDPEKCVLLTQFSIPFSLYVVLGDEYYGSYDYEVSNYIEDIYVRLVGKRQIFTSILLLISVQQK